jgi:hypothetical protein
MRARWLRSLVREHRDNIPKGAGPAGQPSHIFHRRCACPAPSLQWDGGDGGTMAKKDTASKRQAEAARAYARYTINLQRAFGDLLSQLKRAYGQPARDATELRRHVLALLAIAGFLNRMGPDGDLADFANQFAKLAQTLRDVDDGIRAPILTPTLANRADQSVVWIARAYVALAVETMRRCGHSRKEAAHSAADKHPGLKKLITERGVHRSDDIETAIISWCEDFSRRKVKNYFAARIYSVHLDKLKASAPNCNSDQMKDEAGRLLQKAIDLVFDLNADETNVGISPY